MEIRYTTTKVVFQEIPGEISLAINVSGCPHRCKGCHSPELQEDIGTPLLPNIGELMDKNHGITCVIFMGGDHNVDLLIKIVEKVKERKLRAAIYSGNESYLLDKRLFDHFDYVKYGKWIESKGGLSSKNTNQKMLKLDHKTGRWEDITYLFQEEVELGGGDF